MRTKWTQDAIQQEALKHQTRNDFRKKNRNAYKAARRRGILDDVCKHMDSVYTYWTDEMIEKEASLYQKYKEFREGSTVAFVLAKKRGILQQVCSHMIRDNVSWDINKLKQEAKLFSSRCDFMKHSSSAYNVARQRGVLDEVCSHMDYIRTYWTDEDLEKEAKMYKTRTEFQRYGNNAYAAAWNRGILDKICIHMLRGKSGFDPNKKSSFYVVRLTGMVESYVGFGISNDVQQRLKEHKRNSASFGFSLDVIMVLDFETGHSIEVFEKELKSKLPIASSGVEGFKTEAVLKKDESLLFDAISEWKQLLADGKIEENEEGKYEWVEV